MKEPVTYRCQRRKHTYEATFHPHNGRWDLVIEMVVGKIRLKEFEQCNYHFLLSAMWVMHNYFPYGTVKWNRIR